MVHQQAQGLGPSPQDPHAQNSLGLCNCVVRPAGKQGCLVRYAFVGEVLAELQLEYTCRCHGRADRSFGRPARIAACLTVWPSVCAGDGQSQLPWLPVAPPTANHSNSTAHAAPPNPRRVRAQSVAGGYQKQQSEQEQQYHQQQQGQPEQHTVIRRQHSTGSAPL